MGTEQKKLGAVTILMFMLGAFFAPVIYNIASKSDKASRDVPVIATKLQYVGSMVEANTVLQGEMLTQLKALTDSNIVEHRNIIRTMDQNTFTVRRVVDDCEENKIHIKECQDNHIRSLNGN